MTKAITTTNAEFSVVFDSNNPHWNVDPNYNALFLRSIQKMFNDQLLCRGHIFLNEVFDELGFPRTSDGALVGWLLEKDNRVDLGVFGDDQFAGWRGYELGGEEGITLKFNVDGIIYDKI